MTDKERYSLIYKDTILMNNENYVCEIKTKQIPIAINYVRTGKLLDVAICLQARDYKGFNTGFQLMNGVIVIEDE